MRKKGWEGYQRVLLGLDINKLIPKQGVQTQLTALKTFRFPMEIVNRANPPRLRIIPAEGYICVARKMSAIIMGRYVDFFGPILAAHAKRCHEAGKFGIDTTRYDMAHVGIEKRVGGDPNLSINAGDAMGITRSRILECLLMAQAPVQ